MMATEPVNILESSPRDKLFFTGPFHEISKSHITLKNLTYKQLIYKIKTTEPKKYCVRPNLGLIGPQQTVTVTVILQPSDTSMFTFQGQHKFQILHTLKEDPDPKKSPEELWAGANPTLIFHHKLKCYFETSEEGEQRKKDEKLEVKIDNLKDASKVIDEMKSKIEQLKQQNAKLNISLTESQKQLDHARKPSQFPSLLLYTVIAILGWLFAKFVM